MWFVRSATRRPRQPRLSAETDAPGLVGGVLWQARWVALAGLLLLSFALPLVGGAGLPTWSLILAFVLYNLALELLCRRVRLLQAPAARSLVDLPVVMLLYVISAGPGGPVYVLMLLVVSCAAATLSLRAGLVYTGVITVLMASVMPWQARELGAELLVVILVSTSIALLTWQLLRTQAEAATSRDEVAAWPSSMPCARASSPAPLTSCAGPSRRSRPASACSMTRSMAGSSPMSSGCSPMRGATWPGSTPLSAICWRSTRSRPACRHSTARPSICAR